MTFVSSNTKMYAEACTDPAEENQLFYFEDDNTVKHKTSDTVKSCLHHTVTNNQAIGYNWCGAHRQHAIILLPLLFAHLSLTA